MKTPNGIKTEIHNLLDLFVNAEVALAVNPVVWRQLGSGFKRITWANSNFSFDSLKEFGSVGEYYYWLESGNYSAILFDGSIIQLSYDFLGNTLVKHRLTYYPCPFDIEYSLLKEEPLLEIIELYMTHLDSSLRLRSPFRFDYDELEKGLNHPASHLTIISETCRWAVTSPLCPGHFIKFVFRHFYHNLWSSLSFLRDWPQYTGDRTITPEEELFLHVSVAR